MKSFSPTNLLGVIFLLGLLPSECDAAARFGMNGPVLTVTLKDPATSSSSEAEPPKWLNLANFKPNLSWTLNSNSKPLPNWLPSLQSLRCTLNYDYLASKTKPTVMEGAAAFEKAGFSCQVQPMVSLLQKKSMWLLQIQKGTTSLFCKVANRGVEMVRGSHTFDLPYLSVSKIRMTPQLNLQKGEPSCLLEATTQSQRTKTVLNLEYSNPSLTIIHALDERHVIAPEISLYNAKIVYQWDIALDSGSIKTKVDPTEAIHVTWTDLSKTGRWVTDFRLPLVGTSLSSLAADVRVRRQFRF